jgi:hypothetical protein
MMFASSLLGRTVQFTENAEKNLAGKIGEIVSVYVNGGGNLTYVAEVDGLLTQACLNSTGANMTCKLVAKE